MGLLNPLLLALGAAAAVPLLLHLLQRHHGPRVIFPALRYLRRAERESARRIRVRQILLMMLRIAAVLLIAVAAARPFMRAGGTGHSPTAAVIILDNSLGSTVVEGERRVLDELKARALDVLEEAGPDDRFWLLRAGAPDEPALAGDAESTAMRVRETEPTPAAADLPAALARARAVLAAGADGRATEVHLLSDLQASSFPAPAAASDGAPPVIVWHPGTTPPPNRAVAHVELGGGLPPIANERTTVAATIAGDGDDPVTVRLTVDGRLVAAATARPGETAMLSLPPRPEGIVTGRVEIDADALHADDARYFAARILPPPSVAVTGPLPFVDDALEVLTAAGRVRRAGAGAADVLILPGAQGLDAAGSRGAVVVLPPTQAVELPAVNRRLAAAGIPWRFAVPVAGEARLAATDGDALLRSLEGARLREVYPLVAEGTTSGDSILLRLTDGTPWAARGERRTGGTYVLIGSPLSPEASTLPTSAAMLPLLDRITGDWAMTSAPPSDARPGQQVTVPEGATAVARPDGARDDVTSAATYALGMDPGVYRFVRGDSTVAAFAVNPAAMPDLTRLDRRGLEARLPGWSLHVTTDAAAFRRAAFRERLGREVWRPLLVTLLAVLLLETVVAASGRARRATADERPVTQTETA
ncbi:hypothetical protein BH23GEM9_BH23GEM9_11630 [soil metagenome]